MTEPKSKPSTELESKPRGPGRPRTGTIAKNKAGLWQAVVRYADGSRKRLPPFPRGMSEARARDLAAVKAAEAALVMPPPKPTAETSSDLPSDTAMHRWLKSWIADRLARGQTSTREPATHYRMHIARSLGPKHIQHWTRDELRKLSADLDRKVQGGEISWKTAQNIWGTATRLCADAAESKQAALRCRKDNPAIGVRGPDRGDEMGLQFLWPSEFLQFVTCEQVPLKWRRLVAVAIYTYTRDAELRVIECSDLDVTHRVVHITKAKNRRTGEIKAPKGKRARHPPMEPALVPLLAAMKADRSGEGLLVPEFPSERDMARGLRRWLWKAGVRRAELHQDTPTTRPVRWHDLRSTGCTWAAVRGDDPLKIQQRAGHTDFETTQRYIRLAEMLRESFGEVFPDLPAELCGGLAASDFSSPGGSDLATPSRKLSNSKLNLRGGRDSKSDDQQEPAETETDRPYIERGNERVSEGKCPNPGPVGQTLGQTRDPRSALVSALTAAIGQATAAGDLHAARVAHEALGRLLGQGPEPVADLSTERARRTGGQS